MARIETEIRSENSATASNDTEQSEVNNRCALLALQIEVELSGEQRRCWGDQHLLCEQDDGVYF